MVTIDEMHEMLNEISEEFPEEFYKDLNGGISLLPDKKRSPYAVGDDLFILGEYHYDKMGRYIYIFYGSFMQIYGQVSKTALRKRLKKTVAHEFTHHLESLAGERGLEIKDEIQKQEYLERKMRTYKKDVEDGMDPDDLQTGNGDA